MSYAIIRNEKYTKDKLIQISPHNERLKKLYSNKNIDKDKTSQNYHIKKPKENNYLKEFKRLKEQNNLKGQIHKNSIYVCEMIVTSDNKFFETIGKEEMKRYFYESYKFIASYKYLGEENIISAVVHLDEKTPHMHLVFIPVVNSTDKDKNKIRKISNSEFWKEKNSYTILQNKFYEYIKSRNFNLERGKSKENNKHISTDDLKRLTNFYNTKKLENSLLKEQSSNLKYNNINEFSKIEDFSMKSVEEKLLKPIINKNKILIEENNNLKIEISKSKNVIEYYKQLENEKIELEHKINRQNIERKAMYKIINKFNNKYENLLKMMQEKYNIDIKMIKENFQSEKE